MEIGLSLLVFFVGSLATAVPAHNRDEALKLHPLPVSEPAIDLATAVKRAIAHNYSVLQAQEKLEQDKNDTDVIRSYLYPNVNLNLSAGEFRSGMGSFGITPFGGKRYEQYVADLKLTQPLMVFGSLSAVRASDSNSLLHKLDLKIAIRDLTANVIQSFYKVLLNQQLLHNLEKIQKVMTESLITAERRLKTGRGQLLDVLQVKTQMALLQPQIEDAHNQLEASGAQLATYLSEQGKYYLQLSGDLKALHLKDVKKWLDSDSAELPELEQVRIKHAQLQEQKWVLKGKHLPSLNLVGDYGATTYRQANLLAPSANAWSLQLQLTIPIFSGFQSIYEQRSLSSQDAQLQLAGHDLENSLALRQVQSLKALESTEASLLSSGEAAHLADLAMAEANRNYRLANIDFLQFLSVEQSSLQAYSALENIEYSNLVAFTNYFVATGHNLSILVDILEGRKK